MQSPHDRIAELSHLLAERNEELRLATEAATRETQQRMTLQDENAMLKAMLRLAAKHIPPEAMNPELATWRRLGLLDRREELLASIFLAGRPVTLSHLEAATRAA